MLSTLVSYNCYGRELFLHPSDFSELPKNAKAELEKINCLIPQTRLISGRHNVVHGELAKKGQTDWVVFCYSKKDKTSVLKVIWGGDAKCTGNVTQPHHEDLSNFVNFVTIESPENLHEYEIPSMKHQAILLHYGNEGGTAYYCNGSKWQGYGTGD